MSTDSRPNDEGRCIQQRSISASARQARARVIEQEQLQVPPQEHEVLVEQPSPRPDDVFDPMPTWDGPELNILSASRGHSIREDESWQSTAQSSGGSWNVSEAGTGRGLRNKRKHVADETWLVRGPMGGGPQDDLIIPSFGGHVAVDVWNGIERGVLKCHARSILCKQLITTLPECNDVVQARIRGTGLSHLPAIMFKYLDMALISAFVERWQPDTNSFHMPFGEMTVLLHDVEMILGIPIIGGSVASTISVEAVEEASAELFGKDVESFLREDWNGGNIDGQALMARCVAVGQSENFQFLCYMLTLFSSTLFVDKTGTKVRANLLPVVDSQLSWGSATLANLYLQLGIASRAKARDLCGCCTLLQAWIYEYFPMFRPRLSTLPALPGRANRWHSGEKTGKDIQRLVTIRRQLDALQAHQVDWLPYGPDVVRDARGRTHYRGVIRYFEAMEAYMPDRVVRQFGVVQGMPYSFRIVPEPCSRPADPSGYSVTYSGMMQLALWDMAHAWHNGQLAEYPIATSQSDCTLDYEDWFTNHSHPLIINPVHDGTSCGPYKTHLDLLLLNDMMSDLDQFDSTTIHELVDPVMKELLTTWICRREEYLRRHNYEPIP